MVDTGKTIWSSGQPFWEDFPKIEKLKKFLLMGEPPLKMKTCFIMQKYTLLKWSIQFAAHLKMKSRFLRFPPQKGLQH